MAKLYYGPDFGTITVRNDDDVADLKNEIEVTAEQALAVAAFQAAGQLANISTSLDEISSGLGALERK